jgi:hypothetical protein
VVVHSAWDELVRPQQRTLRVRHIGTLGRRVQPGVKGAVDVGDPVG